MCKGDDHNCPQFEQHRQRLLDELDAEGSFHTRWGQDGKEVAVK